MIHLLSPLRQLRQLWRTCNKTRRNRVKTTTILESLSLTEGEPQETEREEESPLLSSPSFSQQGPRSQADGKKKNPFS